MSTLRVGLKHVSNNSPALSLLHKKGNLQAALPQLSKTLQIKAPTEENKENSTQIPEAELQSSSTQTVISVLKQDIAITKEDLTSDTPSVSYWRGMVETFERDAESELERSFNLSLQLDQSVTELEEAEKKLEILTNVLKDTIEGDNNEE